VKRTGVIHTEAGITEALRRFDRGQSEVGSAVLDMISSGLRDTPPVMATCSGMEPEEIDAFISLAAHQVIVDLAGLVLPNIHLALGSFNRAERLIAELSHRLSYEIFSPGPLTFLRWMIEEPGRILSGNVDQLALAQTELPERRLRFAEEMNMSRTVRKYHDEQVAAAGLPPVQSATDLTVDHVLLFGAMHTVQGYQIIPGQRIPRLIRWVCGRQWATLSNRAAKSAGTNDRARQKAAFPTRGYGFPLGELQDRARREAKPLVRDRRQGEAETRRAEREAHEATKSRRRDDAKALQVAAAAAVALEVEERAAAQRDSLKRKSQRDRDRWERAQAAREAATAAIDLRNKELLSSSKKDARRRKAERTQERAERDAVAEVERKASLDAQRAALPVDLQGASELIDLLKRDARSHAPCAEARELAVQWDRTFHSVEWALRVDPDLRDTVETWLRNELSSDEWLEHLDDRGSEWRRQAVELRLLDAQRARERREATEEQAAALEADRAPGSQWSEHLRILEALTTEERIERLKGGGFVGPSSGFGTLERHLHGEVTDRERRNYGSERWQDIGSAYAELRALERLAFYHVTVRFARELPGVLNPDFLIIDTIGELASDARIRPMDVKKIYLDRAEDGRTREENATYHFGEKLEKAGRQLAEGMRRYGNHLPDRRGDGFRDELGGTALFVLQSRDPDLHRAGYLDSVCERLEERLVLADNARLIEAVDCVIVILDHVDGLRLQRPIMAMHRASTAHPEGDGSGWTEEHAYIDYLTSRHNVCRSIRAHRNVASAL